MYDVRTFTKKQLRDLARVTSEDGWMTTGQLRRVTGLKHSEIYARTRQLRIGCKREFGIFLFLIDDVLAAIRVDQLPVQREAPAGAPTKIKSMSLRLTEAEGDALEILAAHYRKTPSATICHLILTAHKNLA